MKLYLAGWQATSAERETQLIKAGATTHRCISFANLIKMPGWSYYIPGVLEGYEVCVKHNIGIMFDSGVFSYRQFRRKLIARDDKKTLAILPDENAFTQLYVDYCKKNAKHWDFYVTMDLSFDSAANFKRHVFLEKAGLRPVPVIHGDMDGRLSILERYKDRGYSYVCLGSDPRTRTSVRQKRAYFDSAFNILEKLGMTAHGLAVTAPWLVLSYPWYSVDSSSWSRAAGYGNIIRFNVQTGRMTSLHISEKGNIANAKSMSLDAMACGKAMRRAIEAEGYDFTELQESYTARHEYNAFTMQELAKAANSHNRGEGWRQLF